MTQPDGAAASAFAEDYQLIYPTLPRGDLEQLLAAISNVDAFGDGPGTATAVEPWAQAIAARIHSFAAAATRAGYVRRMRGCSY